MRTLCKGSWAACVHNLFVSFVKGVTWCSRPIYKQLANHTLHAVHACTRMYIRLYMSALALHPGCEVCPSLLLKVWAATWRGGTNALFANLCLQRRKCVCETFVSYLCELRIHAFAKASQTTHEASRPFHYLFLTNTVRMTECGFIIVVLWCAVHSYTTRQQCELLNLLVSQQGMQSVWSSASQHNYHWAGSAGKVLWDTGHFRRRFTSAFRQWRPLSR